MQGKAQKKEKGDFFSASPSSGRRAWPGLQCRWQKAVGWQARSDHCRLIALLLFFLACFTGEGQVLDLFEFLGDVPESVERIVWRWRLLSPA